ncbi:ectodysplasin-A receptor-associated adapter protein [Amia ocellicauda]|uniref:ectodysplasin-A receptor-associated adapter protein n=1 Tax=Amia ocellicauda TaxID=2972642 RepID=UPI003463A478
MASLKPLDDSFYDRIMNGPVEDTDPSSTTTGMSLSKYPVQVADTTKDAVTLQIGSVKSEYLMPPSDRIRQPEDNGSFLSETTQDFFKRFESSCESCYCSVPPPKISDLMNDEDLLYFLRLKLDPNYSTIKNWKNFASKWGMTYDELNFLEHRTQGSTHSPTQEFLQRNNEKTVKELTDLCITYQRIDVLRKLQKWVEKDWPKRWQKAH